MAYEIGGRADKYGNRFETNWTIRKLLEVIEEKIESVTIEAIGDDEKGADLWIPCDGGIRIVVNPSANPCNGALLVQMIWYNHG